jgi:hypothetical protein
LNFKGWKNLQGESSRPGERSGNDRYRILLSDGKYSYAYGMLATQLNHLITDGNLESFTIIKVKKVICNKITSKNNNGKDPKKIIIILELDILMPGSEVSCCRRTVTLEFYFIYSYRLVKKWAILIH